MQLDAVVGYHLNPHTCGVAKFNAVLAQRFDAPVIGLFDPRVSRAARPLVSIKVSEFTNDDRARIQELSVRGFLPETYDLFLHDYRALPLENEFIDRAARVLVGNAELALQIRERRSDVEESFCPGTIDLSAELGDPEIAVFTFGMAHKIHADYYERLDQLLAMTGRSYSLYVSTALHEGTSFDGSFSASFDALRGVFGGPVHFLGFLSDAAVAAYLSSSTYFAAFFERGARANNTSINSAMQAGAVVVTNLDEFSPPGLRHMETVVDLGIADRLPDGEQREHIKRKARAYADEHGWEQLVAQLEKA